MLLNFLGGIPLRRGDHYRATQLFGEALRVSRQVRATLPLLLSLYNLALIEQAGGDLSEAAGHLEEGLSLASEVGGEASAAYYLEEVAALAWLQDDLKRAARLYGAADTLHEGAGSVWLGFISNRSRHNRSGVRSRMEGVEFEAALAEGRAMGRERAVAYALRREA